MDRALSALFVAAAGCGQRQGIAGQALHKYHGPDGLFVVLNSTRERAEHIEPLHMAIYAREGQAFPIAVLNPFEGQVIANPDWTEDALIAAFNAHGDGPATADAPRDDVKGEQ